MSKCTSGNEHWLDRLDLRAHPVHTWVRSPLGTARSSGEVVSSLLVMASDAPHWLQQARSKWSNTGSRRPPFAHPTEPGQESVWDYPRPPVVQVDARLVIVGSPDDPLAQSSRAVRVLETAGPPTVYLPHDDVNMERLAVVAGSSVCEWKGPARYWALVDGGVESKAGNPEAGSPEAVAWDYPDPFPEYAELLGYMAFYPGRIPCLVDGETVRAQSGGFYGGWITDEVVGPFKGDPGTQGW